MDQRNLGLISRLGRWLDARFPQKISAEEVYRSLTAYESVSCRLTSMQIRLDQVSQKLEAFETGARAFDKTLSEVKDELNKVKAVQVIQNRQRVAPVMPSGEPWKR